MLERLNLQSVLLLIVSVVILIEVTYLTVMKLRQRKLKVARGSILLDSCSIMDGRIIDLAKTGIITSEIIVPRSVVVEMQLLADKSDHEKRVRARRGLENVRLLKTMDTVSVAIVNDGKVGKGGVDERLLDIAKNYDASIATTDFNLNRVAKVMDVPVINVNEIAQVMRANHFPGDQVEIELLQAGANRSQAVGYLDDGTMVVVEDSKDLIGSRVKVEIIRSLQTEAGRMMFAKKIERVVQQNNKPAAHKRDKSVSAKIKSAPAFHSDQLPKQHSTEKAKSKSEAKRNNGSTTKASRRRTPSQSSVERQVVALANAQQTSFDEVDKTK